MKGLPHRLPRAGGAGEGGVKALVLCGWNLKSKIIKSKIIRCVFV